MRSKSFPMPTWSTLPSWVIMGAFSLAACSPSVDTSSDDPANTGGSNGEGNGETLPDAETGGAVANGGSGGGGAGGDDGEGGAPVADMSVGLLPDAQIIVYDAAVPPTPDAAIAPAPDAAIAPTPDAAIPPTPDAFIAPTPDAAIPPTPDAFIPPTPDAAIPPTPDAFIPPPDAFIPLPDAFVPPPPAVNLCGLGEVTLGEIGTFCGKVNVHRASGAEWAPDDDCSSGCDIQPELYCRMEFPGTQRVLQMDVSPEDKPFNTGGCGEVFPSPGQAQYACCAPAPVCPPGQHLVGQFATHCGRVNVHASVAGEWAVDNDCSSGCNEGGVPYCQRFWPDTASVVNLPVSEGNKPFTGAGCAQQFAVPGQDQFGCCAPDAG